MLKFGEVFHGFQRALGAEEALDVDAPQRGRIDAMAVLVRADIADRVRGRIRVAIGMAVKAGHALVGLAGCGDPRWH